MESVITVRPQWKVKDGEAVSANRILFIWTQASRASLWYENPRIMHAEKKTARSIRKNNARG